MSTTTSKKSLADSSPILRAILAPRGLVGIDLGGHTVKALRLGVGKLKTTVDTAVILAASLSAEEKKHLLTSKGLGAKAAFSIADERIESHEFRLPKLAKKELTTAINWEIKKTVASPEFVFHDVLTYETAKGVEIQCVVASKEIVKSRFDEGVSYGMSPKFLETESSALASCLSHLRPEKELHREAIIDLGHASFRLILLHHGRVSFTRSLYFGTSTLCHQVAASVSQSPEVILNLLSTLGNPPSESLKQAMSVLERSIQESLYTLCEEFRRSEFYLKEQKGLEDIQNIWLCGGGACWPNIGEYLSKHLGEKTISLLNPLKTIKKLPEGLSAEHGPLWACAFGLAMRQRK